MKAVVLCSGGMDSVTLVYHIRDLFGPNDMALLSFHYGQKHVRELKAARAVASDLGVSHDIIQLPKLRGSVLTAEEGAIPEGHYAAANMKQTVVPMRNPIMLTVAANHAAAMGFDTVAAAMHAGDHYVYPDCRPLFASAFRTMLHNALQGLAFVDTYFPFLMWTKARIAKRFGELGLDPSTTWSCYNGEDVHCGRCGTCVERIEAFVEAGVEDTTEYADAEFWKSATSTGAPQ